jgi:hypothetical protein
MSLRSDSFLPNHEVAADWIMPSSADQPGNMETKVNVGLPKEMLSALLVIMGEVSEDQEELFTFVSLQRIAGSRHFLLSRK